jgi:hypothetical protein
MLTLTLMLTPSLHGHGEEGADDALNPATHGFFKTLVVFEHMDEDPTPSSVAESYGTRE